MLRDFRILIVDDSSPSRLVISKVLSEILKGAQLDVVSSGADALEKIASTPYDLIILDLGLPDISGLQVLDTISHSELDCPVITISDESSQEFLSKSLEKGAVQYLTKPVNKNQLISVLKEVFDLDNDSRFKQILVVDDEKINLKLLSVLLQKNGYFVTLASRGQEAIDLNDAHRFDAILMDIRMPEMSGIEASEIIYGKTPDVPIIAVTAGSSRKISSSGMRSKHGCASHFSTCQLWSSSTSVMV